VGLIYLLLLLLIFFWGGVGNFDVLHENICNTFLTNTCHIPI
jgi:hypothetical protein